MSISKSRETKGKKVKDEPTDTAALPVPEQETPPADRAVLPIPDQATKEIGGHPSGRHSPEGRAVLPQSRDGHKEVLPIPNLIKIQLDSYDWFLKEGLRELFQSFSPIEDFTGKLSLEFLDYSIGEPKYPVQECRERDVSYEAPLKVRVMLINKESKGEIKESEVYLGELPLMTERGTFIINGAERVVVSQLARSPGVYFRDSIDISGSTLHAAQCIPSEGGWVEFDIGSDGVISVRIGQTRKFPVTTLLRAFEFFEEAMPGPPEVREVNPQTAPLEGHILADRVVDIQTGEILGESGQAIDADLAERLRTAEAISPVRIQERPFPCATTPDLIRLFGEERVLGMFPRYAEDVEGEEGEIGFSAEEMVQPEHLEKLKEWGYESVLVFPPGSKVEDLLRRREQLEEETRSLQAELEKIEADLPRLETQRQEVEEAQADLPRQIEQRQEEKQHLEEELQKLKEEWTMEELRDSVQSRALTVENLTQARSLLEVRVPGEVEPLVRPYQRISYPIAQVLVEMELETFPVIVLDAPVEATLAEDPIREVEEQLQLQQRQLEGKKHRLEKELQQFKETQADLLRRKEQLEKETQSLQAELERVEADLLPLRTQLQEREEAQADLPPQIEQRQEERQGLEKKLKKLEADLKRQRKQVQEGEEARADLTRQMEPLEEGEEKQGLEKELQKLEANLHRKREQLKQKEEAQADLLRRREQLEEETRSLQAELERVEADLPRLRTQRQEREEAQADLTPQIEQRQQEIQRLEAEQQSLRTQVEEREKELKTIEGDLKRIEDELRKKTLEEIYRVLRPGDPPSQESGRSLLRSTFFDIRRYDLARVGRFKINKKLGLNLPLEVRTLTKLDLIAIIAYLVALHQRSGTPGTRIERIFRQLSGNPDLELDFEVDDIDHLENKRVRAVGELLQNTLRLGFLRMERVARERMTSLEPENTTAQAIISIKPITAAIKSFFGSGTLSQFMDQTNPLSELAHKRRLSAMGPGGLSRQSAKLEVRDVHRSHYGRICPIMTPEGPNIGLIGSLAMYARVDEFGFLETPYRRVRRGVASDTVVWLKADEEARYAIAPANVPLDENGRIIPERVICRKGNQFPLLSRNEIELMDVSPKQIFSTATSLIPFLENDDANRALMGSNMQRQAVPLVRTDAPLVKTGIERRVAVDSGAVVVAGIDGVVTRVTANEICIQGYDGTEEKHSLLKFMRTNQATFINQKPLVRKGQHVTAGQPIADGSCTDQGELALGRNVLVAFMPWEGYNYEDAIILSERMVRDDVFTSIHIDKYELQARETKLGPEEITGDIPNVGDEMLRNLDERGIIRLGVEIHPEDILVGKVAPKGQAEMTAEEKLVIAIFGKKAEEMRDTSLRVPHGAKGKVVDVKVFSRYKFVCQKCQTRFDFARSSDLHECEKCGGELVREQGDELPPGINQLVRVYVAQRRKIMEGDKMAGRHGNKGVIAKILPLEDMPHLPDGRPVDIILNPLGVPSRMNIGQILETHLGWVARAKGVTYENPVFQSMKEEEILAGLAEVTEKQRESVLYDYLSMEIPRLEEHLPQGATSGELLDILRSYLAGLSPEELAEQVQHFAAGPRYYLAADVPHPHQEGIFLGRQDQRITEELLHQLWRYGVGTVVLRDARGQEASRPVAAVLEELRAVEEHFSREELIDFVVEQIQDNVLERVGFDPQTGKCVLYDGRTGEPFRQPVCIGEIYMMKLHHLVDDKIHARSTGPYSLVTQQPLGGKAQFGGQRFGEMEVWALEAYGAAYTLQEILTIKSDDVLGRVKTYENIVKGENILEPGIPESFKILIKELQSLGLQVTVKSREGEAMDLRDAEEQ